MTSLTNNVVTIITDVYGIEGTIRGDELWTNCPSPDHSDRTPSFSINLDTGLYLCLGCGIKGNLVSLGVLLWDEPYRVVEAKLGGFGGLVERIRRQIGRLSHPDQDQSFPLTRYGPYESGPLTFLTSKGYAIETLRKWGVRFVPTERVQEGNRTFVITSSIAIPVITVRNEYVGWIYRRTDSSYDGQPKYLYTHNLPIRHLWFGLHRHNRVEEIVIVEGALDAIWLDQIGIPALAVLGSQVSEHKINQLRRYKRVTLFFDKDHAGLNATRKVGDYLSGRTSVRVVLRPRGIEGTADPTDFSLEECQIMIRKAKPYRAWKLKKTFSKKVLEWS